MVRGERMRAPFLLAVVPKHITVNCLGLLTTQKISTPFLKIKDFQSLRHFFRTFGLDELKLMRRPSQNPLFVFWYGICLSNPFSFVFLVLGASFAIMIVKFLVLILFDTNPRTGYRNLCWVSLEFFNRIPAPG